MGSLSSRQVLLVTLISILFIASSPRAAEIHGTVTDAEIGAPVPSTHVRALIIDDAVVARTETDAEGNYQLANLAERSYTLEFSRLGYAGLTVSDVWARRFGETVVNVSLDPSPLGTDTLVVTASRQKELGLGAPASTSVIDRLRLSECLQLTPYDLTQEVTGVDFASKGMIQRTLSMRGVRWTLSVTPLLLTDYRFAHLPMLDYTLGYMIPASSDDVERIEVVRGPSTAMYGPNSAQGVIHVITRSPFDSPGTMISVAGGERSLFQGTFRHASVVNEKLAIKISGRWLQGNDWEYIDPIEQQNREEAIADGADPDTLLIGKRDPRIRNVAGEARLDWRISPATTMILTAGLAEAINLIDISHAIGAFQYQNWRSSFVQTRLMSGQFLANVFYNVGNSGDTYALRTGLPIKDNSRVIGAQLQHGTDPSEHLKLDYGLDGRYTDPRTFHTITGRNEDDDTATELGGYLSTTTLLSSKWDLVAALRLDYHDRLEDLALSPRLGAVFKPTPSQALRLTWNRAFNSPSAVEVFVDLPAGSIMPGMDITVAGFSQNGYTFTRSCDGGLCMRSPLHPSGTAALMPTDATLMWPAVVQILANAGIDLSGLPAPNTSQVGTDLRALDIQQGGFTEVMDASEVTDAAAVGRIIRNTFELGYKGRVGNRAFLGLDVYRTYVENYYSDMFALNPNVFLNPDDLQSYLENVGGLPSGQAAAVAAAAAGIPVGTVVPDGQDTAEVLLVNKMGGSFSLWGADLTAELSLSRTLVLSGSYSWLEKNIAVMPGFGVEVFSVPRNKAGLGLTYRGLTNRLDGMIQGRWVESFPVGSGVYFGQIGTYIVFDVGVGYRISWEPDVRVSLNATNVLDNRHQEWIGAPELGRVLVARLQMNF